MKTKTLTIYLGIFVIFSYILIVFLKAYIGGYFIPRRKIEVSDVPSAVNITGKSVCLEHKPNLIGYQTMECAYGFRDTNGKDYELDLDSLPEPNNQFDVFTLDGPFKVEGVLHRDKKSLESKYFIDGVIKVEKIIK